MLALYQWDTTYGRAISVDHIAAESTVAALLVFAIGIRGAESVTARRPLGTTALALLAACVLGRSVTDALGERLSLESLTAIASIAPFAHFALALIAVVQAGRTAAVPPP